ncbi:membrane protein [Mycoplasma testudineum]|uniref:Membrane protein n=1 Tax=Mycoplasma testudineum TaxID=244584 RepID=A0A4R6IF92_9MOLU|nr:YhjD/YihY/BrkB family envelope integrity protein [Mycoplasma testudineum]OYD26898.1 hypothetical protein CG473_00980 [Mycoplasma testudineum]TDO20446.1 membrane protein [Mycoplasma testudineum]
MKNPFSKKKNKKIYSGWSGYESKPIKKDNFLKSKFRQSWVQKKAITTINEGFKIKELIVKFLINISLTIIVSGDKIKNRTKRIELVERIYERLGARDFSFIPVATAFYLFVSFIPIIFFASMIVSSVPQFSEILSTDVFDRIIPGLSFTVESIFLATSKASEGTPLNVLIYSSFFNNTGAAVGIVILMVSLVWFSSTGYSKLIYSMSYIYEHKNYGNGLVNRLKSIFIMTIITLYLSIFLLGFSAFVNEIKTNVTGSNYEFLYYLNFVVISTFFYYFGLVLLLKFTPKFKLTFGQVQPGVLISLIPLVILTSIFSLIVSLSSLNSLGFISSIFFITSFVLLFSYFLYAGIIANEAYYKTFHSLRTVSKYIQKR